MARISRHGGYEPTGCDATALLIDLESHKATPMTELALADAGLRERDDLQRWVTEHPGLIAPDLELVTTEFDRWEIKDQKVYDRLDALFLDSSGAPVVVEFKRDRASDTVELQALKYAAYCSQLTLDELVEEFARAHDCSEEEAKP
jgi:RecB family endonuclease NucS